MWAAIVAAWIAFGFHWAASLRILAVLRVVIGLAAKPAEAMRTALIDACSALATLAAGTLTVGLTPVWRPDTGLEFTWTAVAWPATALARGLGAAAAWVVHTMARHHRRAALSRKDDSPFA